MNNVKGHLKVASSIFFACAFAGLSGCGSVGLTPLGASIQAAVSERDVTVAQAEAIPYASLTIRIGQMRGLMIMGAQAGAFSYWPSPDGLILEFQNDSLTSIHGLAQELLSSTYRIIGENAEGRGTEPPPWHMASPGSFQITRRWLDEHGRLHVNIATGEMHCGAVLMRELPLGPRPLQRCDEQLAWSDGTITTATLWRDPELLRLWEYNGAMWPGSPRIHWQVARHWW